MCCGVVVQVSVCTCVYMYMSVWCVHVCVYDVCGMPVYTSCLFTCLWNLLW